MSGSWVVEPEHVIAFQLIFAAAAHLAETRLLLRRAIPDLSANDAAELTLLSGGLRALIFWLENKTANIKTEMRKTYDPNHPPRIQRI